MSPQEEIQPTPWGESEIRGPTHLFRERLLFRLFVPLLAEGGHVLDAGCGSGSMAADLARTGFRVDALDCSFEFVEMVRHKMARYGEESRVAVRHGSVTELPFDDEVFDGVVCGEVLEHIPHEEGGDHAAVAELKRVMKPCGICVASVPLNPKLWDESDDWAGHARRYTRDGFSRLFDDHGFTVETTRVWGFPLGRIYHRLLFSPWIRRTSDMEKSVRDARADTRAAANRHLVELVAGAFRLDEMFANRDWGCGVVLVAKKTRGNG